MGNKQGSTTKKTEVKKVEEKPVVQMTPETYDFNKVDKSQRVFGVDLAEVMQRLNSTDKLPKSILAMIEYTEKNIETPKIFKEEGGKTQCNVLTYNIDNNKINSIEDLNGIDIHVVVTVLKKLVREIPGGIMSCDSFAKHGDIQDKTELWKVLKEEIPKNMTPNNEFFLFHLARLLNLAMKSQEKNEMELAYLTQAFRMNLMISPTDMNAAMKFSSQVKNVCDAIIEGFEEIFIASRYQ